VLAVERKIARFMKTEIDQAIGGIKIKKARASDDHQ
jgi:hypothetical protein